MRADCATHEQRSSLVWAGSWVKASHSGMHDPRPIRSALAGVRAANRGIRRTQVAGRQPQPLTCSRLHRYSIPTETDMTTCTRIPGPVPSVPALASLLHLAAIATALVLLSIGTQAQAQTGAALFTSECGGCHN